MEPSDLLFRREAEALVATLTRIFGVYNLTLAEDMVQVAFCRAVDGWNLRGMPEKRARKAENKPWLPPWTEDDIKSTLLGWRVPKMGCASRH
jgi:hypothetical protein